MKLGGCVNTFQRGLLPPLSVKKSSILKTEAAASFETLVPTCPTTRDHNSEDCTLNIHSHRNLRCHLYLKLTLLVAFILIPTILVMLVLLLSRSGNTLRGVLLRLELLDVKAEPSLCPLTSGVQRFITLHDICCRKTQT